jgi:hypothetical protein
LLKLYWGERVIEEGLKQRGDAGYVHGMVKTL